GRSPCLFTLPHLPTPGSTLFPYTTLFRSVGFAERTRKVIADKAAHLMQLHMIVVAHRQQIAGELRAVAALFGLEDHGPSPGDLPDRKSTRLNSSHVKISYAVFCLKKKKRN